MFQSNTVVDHIVQFTSQRDQELLSFSLLKSVNKMMLCTHTMLVTLNSQGKVVSNMTFDGINCDIFKSCSSVTEKVLNACERMRIAAIEEHNMRSEDKCVAIRSIYNNKKIQQFLVIELEDELTNVQLYVLSGILNIYNNFITLLNDAQTDELTGLANRKTFDSAISKVFDGLNITPPLDDGERRTNKLESDSIEQQWLAIIDIDNFKYINDNYGHLYGDEILIELAQLIRTSFRFEDLQFRFGGEEFVVLLGAENKAKCFTILERFRKRVSNHRFSAGKLVTVSIGVVEFKRDVFHVTSIDYADKAMYQSKNNGKNCVTFFEDLLDKGVVKEIVIDGGEVELF